MLKNLNKIKISAYFCILTGIVINIYGVDSYLYNQYFSKNAVRTTGTIVEIKDYKKKKIFAPIYNYKDQNNVEQKSISYFSSDSKKYSIGQNVEVLFDPNDPSYSKINDNFSPRMVNVMPFFLGTIICLIGGIILRSNRKLR